MNTFVLGVDLDGVCADFYGRMRDVVAEWRGEDVNSLTADVSYGLPEWGVTSAEYPRIHRFAVTQHELFRTVAQVQGAAPAIRRLEAEGVHIRIITHRLFISQFHQIAVAQTVEWLDRHAIPYWDLCFIREKTMVDANLYIEDSPHNVAALEAAGRDVIVFTNSTNKNVSFSRAARADDWATAESLVRDRYQAWLTEAKQESSHVA